MPLPTVTVPMTSISIAMMAAFAFGSQPGFPRDRREGGAGEQRMLRTGGVRDRSARIDPQHPGGFADREVVDDSQGAGDLVDGRKNGGHALAVGADRG